MNSERLLARFLRYVQIDTTANAESTSYPSSPGQLDLGRMLVAELKACGIADAVQDEHGIVYATMPATVKTRVPVVALNAHVDTSPETSGTSVNPQVIRNYAGGDITLPANKDRVIRVADNPELAKLHGCTLITTDGNTLLGADDKAGVAVIMELAEHLLEHPEIPHGPVRLLFTCDEEIGQGVKHVDLKRLAADVCYTLDGYGQGEIDTETFSADGATIKFVGRNIHPSMGKGRMINAIRAAGEFLARLPRSTLSPETTDGREGFLHPYVLSGGVAEATLQVLLRDFDTSALAQKAELLQQLARAVEKDFPGLTIKVEIRQQYRNLGEGLVREPRAVKFAQEAFRRLGREAKLTIVRGGTDGSQLTALGLPTPNLSTGEHNPHSPLEFSCLEELELAVKMLTELVQVWAK